MSNINGATINLMEQHLCKSGEAETTQDFRSGEYTVNIALWRKCDFQVHSPRDPNWMGLRPVGIGKLPEYGKDPASIDDVKLARAQWAGEFVDQCIKKRLQAIAITDHHEMVMVPYIQREIHQRKENDPNFDLWLFPGMELTAKGGKQCIVIFDSGLEPKWWQQAQGKLGIEFASLDTESASGPKVSQLSCEYPDIGSLLDEVSGLRGKYIILPNVSQGNSHTVLIDGAHRDFQRMPYVGGYLDNNQTINTLTTRNRKRLSGEDPTWSTREIYPLPTSDSRSSDYSVLGTNDTWIKLAEPTAEGIRQAFLGHRSRIRIEPPQIPSLVISAVDVDQSRILQRACLSLSPEFNAIIGGRGSGKSSFLEYIAFGLGRSCYDLDRSHYSGAERMQNLIKETLISEKGRIQLSIVQDNAKFMVVRGPENQYQPQVVYPNGVTQIITVKELRSLFPAVVYSQGELAEIGKQSNEKASVSDLLQFVKSDYKREDDQLAADVEEAKVRVRSAVQSVSAYCVSQASYRKISNSRTSLIQRVEALERSLPALSEDDQSIVKYFDRSDEFESKRIQASKHIGQILSVLESIDSELVIEQDVTNDLGETAQEFTRNYNEFFNTFRVSLKDLFDNLNKKQAQISTAEIKWAKTFQQARDARDGVLEKLGNHKSVTGQIIMLREEIARTTNQLSDLKAKITAQGDPNKNLNESLKILHRINNKRADRIIEWAKEIEKLSSGKIKASVAFADDISEIRDALDVIAAKTNSQEATRRRVLDEALTAGAVTKLAESILEESLELLRWQQMGAATGDEQPKCSVLLTVLGDTARIRAAIMELMDTQKVEAIATAVPRPEISLSYCDGDREISFEKASEGQRAAALLFMLLQQRGGPLIIDQPEGDLDNKIITELTDQLHNAKPNRQLIFASHNANIVVNGSAELVGHLNVQETGVRQFECVGAIDKPEVCLAITSTMEGGKKAFKDRQEKYGY